MNATARDRHSLHVEPVTFDDGELLFNAGDPPTGIFIIEHGTVQVFRLSGGREIPMARLGKGDIVGELAMIEGKPHLRGVRAVGLVDCLLIGPDEFRDLMERSPAALRVILHRLVRKLHRTNTLAYGKSEPPGA